MFTQNSVTKEHINKLFRELRKKGYIAKQSHGATMGSGWHLIRENYTDLDKVVFYTIQDADSFGEHQFAKKDYLTRTLWLVWSGNANEIIEIAKDCGLSVTWGETEQHRIGIQPTLAG